MAAALAAVVGVIAFFVSRDKGTTAAPRPGPGVVDRTATDRLLRAGNVELVYGTPTDGAPLRALADRLGAPDTPAMRKAGQAVILVRQTGRTGVLARAWRRSLRAASAGDPRLQDFVETWLGARASG